jgi:hypothetical protein
MRKAFVAVLERHSARSTGVLAERFASGGMMFYGGTPQNIIRKY